MIEYWLCTSFFRLSERIPCVHLKVEGMLVFLAAESATTGSPYATAGWASVAELSLRTLKYWQLNKEVSLKSRKFLFQVKLQTLNRWQLNKADLNHLRAMAELSLRTLKYFDDPGEVITAKPATKQTVKIIVNEV